MPFKNVDDKVGESGVLEWLVLFGVEALRFDDQVGAFIVAEGLEVSQLFSVNVRVRFE